jgi:hypothetical protein
MSLIGFRVISGWKKPQDPSTPLSQEPMRGAVKDVTRRNPDADEKKARRKVRRQAVMVNMDEPFDKLFQEDRQGPIRNGVPVTMHENPANWEGRLTSSRNQEISTMEGQMFHREAQILEAMRTASIDEQRVLVAELDRVRAHQSSMAQTHRETDFANTVVAAHLTPVAVHELHTTATDWIEDVADPDMEGLDQTMAAEASLWYQRTSPEVREDREEFAFQAMGVARRLGSQFGESFEAAERTFLDRAAFLWEKEASIHRRAADDGTYDPEEWHGANEESMGWPLDSGTSNSGAQPSWETTPQLITETVSPGTESGSEIEPPKNAARHAGWGTRTAEAGPRKRTEFNLCENHAGMAADGRYRMAENFGEGGLGGPCRKGNSCKIKPGTDLFEPSVCGREYDVTEPGHPFSWNQKPRTNVGSRHQANEPAEVNTEQSGEAGSSLPYDHPQGEDLEPFLDEFWPESEMTGPEEVPSTRADNVGGSTASLYPRQANVVTRRAGQFVRQATDEPWANDCEQCNGKGWYNDSHSGGNAHQRCKYCDGTGMADQAGERYDWHPKTPVKASLTRRAITEEQREKAPTLPGTDKFPIRNRTDLNNAKHDIGRTNEPKQKVIDWIDERAKELGAPGVGQSKESALLHMAADFIRYADDQVFDKKPKSEGGDETDEGGRSSGESSDLAAEQMTDATQTGQSGEAGSVIPNVTVGNPNDRSPWPWELGEQGEQPGDPPPVSGAADVGSVPTPGAGVGYPQPKGASRRVVAETDPTCPSCGSAAVSYSKARIFDGNTSKCHNCGTAFHQDHAYGPGRMDEGGIGNPTHGQAMDAISGGVPDPYAGRHAQVNNQRLSVFRANVAANAGRTA